MTGKTLAFIAALGLCLVLAAPAFAQTEEECNAGIEEVNTAIGSQEGVVEGAREEARNLSEQASNAASDQDYARCLELVEEAKGALSSNR